MAVADEAWRLEHEGRSVIWLLAGEPDFGTPPPVVEAAHASIAHGKVHYTSSLGIPALREAISQHYDTRFGADVPVDRIVVTTGASGALSLALAALVDRDERVLMTDPGYPCNRAFTRIFEGVAATVPVGADTGYQLTADHVRSRWDDRTRGVLLATPSNPTGTVVPSAELDAIAAATTELGGTLVVDEIYSELVYDHPPTTVLDRLDDVFVVNSFSKTYGMTGWRLGWLVVPEWALDAVARLVQNLYISAPAPSQWGGVAAFTPEVTTEVERRRTVLHSRRDLLVEGLRSIGFAVPVVPQGAFYVYADCSAFGPSGDVAHRLLHEAGVAVTPGDDFGVHDADRHVRFSYTAPKSRLTEALDRMAKLLS